MEGLRARDAHVYLVNRTSYKVQGVETQPTCFVWLSIKAATNYYLSYLLILPMNQSIVFDEFMNLLVCKI